MSPHCRPSVGRCTLTVAALLALSAHTRAPNLALASAIVPHTGAVVPCGPSQPHPNCSHQYPRQARYNVRVVQRDPVPRGAALISHANGSTAFNFSFTTAWFPAPNATVRPSAGVRNASTARTSHVHRVLDHVPDHGVQAWSEGLVVRVVECNPDHHPCPQAKHPEWTNAGALAVVSADLTPPSRAAATGSRWVPSASRVSYESVQWPGVAAPPPSNHSEWGAADPRLTYRPKDGAYYLTWDNCTQNCYPHRQTLLSTTTNPHDASAWTMHGPVLPGRYTAGASLLFRDDAGGPPHYAFVGNSDTANSILLAESEDGITWAAPANASRQTFMTGRDGCWDAPGVAAGPQPERLSSGDYLYIYNVDTGFPYHPNPLGRCAIGWAILDGDDPTRIVARSDGPLLTATLPWEQCPHKGYTCQETMVVFSTGMKPLGGDNFYVIYGGADTDVGIAKIHVDVNDADGGGGSA